MMEYQSMMHEALMALNPHFQNFLVGSFRRETDFSGDLDFIVTHENPDFTKKEKMKDILTSLKDQGHTLIDLSSSSTDSVLYKGVIKKSNGPKRFRRMDILLVPLDELGASLLYFTGNDLYNRRIRQLAKDKGMLLNQHGLYKVHQGSKELEKLPSSTEEEILDALGCEWTEPRLRLS